MKNLKYIILLFICILAYSCSDDDDPVPTPKPEPTITPTISITLGSTFEVNRFDVVNIDPEVTITDNEGLAAIYQWSIQKNGKDSIIGNQKTLQFISPAPGEYSVDFAVSCGETTETVKTNVSVNADNKSYSSKPVKVLDYLPAPFKEYFLFQYDGGDSKEGLLEYARSKYDDGGNLNLGAFGGYIVLQFDHTVVNTYGKRDLYINCRQTNSPLSIQVAYDANKNGIVDENEWYEIAGSEHHKSTTIKDYAITYFAPDLSKEFVPGKYSWQIDIESVKWTDNKNGSGYITQTDEWGYSGDNFPSWINDSYTLKGTKLYLPTKDVSDGEGTQWNIGTFEWGYGGAKDSNIDISWAVDKDGNKVHLPGINFIRLYNPVFTEIGSSDLLTSSFYSVEDLNMGITDKN